MPKDVAETAKRKSYNKLVPCSSSNELKICYLKIAEELIIGMNKYSVYKYSPIVKRAIEFIHNNKFRFIYAKDVSTAVRMDRSYLSKRFKMETEETLTDYIHKIKMDYAVQLMESNFYKLNEIAEALSYTNYSYFSKYQTNNFLYFLIISHH